MFSIHKRWHYGFDNDVAANVIKPHCVRAHTWVAYGLTRMGDSMLVLEQIG